MRRSARALQPRAQPPGKAESQLVRGIREGVRHRRQAQAGEAWHSRARTMRKKCAARPARGGCRSSGAMPPNEVHDLTCPASPICARRAPAKGGGTAAGVSEFSFLSKAMSGTASGGLSQSPASPAEVEVTFFSTAAAKQVCGSKRAGPSCWHGGGGRRGESGLPVEEVHEEQDHPQPQPPTCARCRAGASRRWLGGAPWRNH